MSLCELMDATLVSFLEHLCGCLPTSFVKTSVQELLCVRTVPTSSLLTPFLHVRGGSIAGSTAHCAGVRAPGQGRAPYTQLVLTIRFVAALLCLPLDESFLSSIQKSCDKSDGKHRLWV